MGKRIKRRSISNHLPAEIVDEILYKLPVKSLLRFKCVSKSWRCFISSKGFIREHLNKSNSGTDFTLHNLIFNYYQPTQIITWSCCIGPLLNDDKNIDDDGSHRSLPSNLSTPIPPLENKNIDLFGSCNGLILVATGNSIVSTELYLWNPSTRKAKNILSNSFLQETTTWQIVWDHLIIGFGYDDSTDDYKVVINFNCTVPRHQTRMFMYSSRTSCWTKIKNFIKGSWPIPNRAATFVNGRLHWLANMDITSWYVVSLDLVVEDKYQIVPPSDHFFDYGYPVYPDLEDLGGNLSFICYGHRISILDVWIMEKESWSKIWTFIRQVAHVPRPIWLKKNGDIVVILGSDLVIYRGIDKSCQSPVDMLNSSCRSRVYVESLVSPFGDNDDELHENRSFSVLHCFYFSANLD